MRNVHKLFGPPGTGKTTALLNLLEQVLEEGVPPERVAYMTFTTKARREAVERAQARFSFTKEQMPYFRTLHSIAYRQLGISGSMMAHKAELAQFAERIKMPISGYESRTESGLVMTNGDLRGDKFLTFDHLRRHRQQSVDEAYKDWREDETIFMARHFCEEYERWKEEEGVFDFTDLLIQADRPLPVDVIFVDEAQDLSALQWRTLEKLAANAERVYVAGDDDQAIFAWAGADPDELLRLEGAITVLDQSYRVPSSVHELAGKMVSRIKRRQPKTWKPREEKGEVRWLTEVDSVDFTREGSYLVLYRNHYLGKPVEARLRSEGVPFGHPGRPTVGADWGQPIVLWEKLRKREALAPSQIHEIYEAMVSGRSLARGARAMLERCEHTSVDMDTARRELGLQTDAPWFEALDKIPADDVAYIRRVVRHHGAKALTSEPKVRISTIHASKGGQADHVVLLTDCSRRVLSEIHREPDGERRVFYVGLTRARSTLQLVGFHNPLFSFH